MSGRERAWAVLRCPPGRADLEGPCPIDGWYFARGLADAAPRHWQGCYPEWEIVLVEYAGE